jgi:hypothetical protein
MFDRYNITSEADLDDAAKRMPAYRDARKGLESGLNGDKNRDSAEKEEGPRIAQEPLNSSQSMVRGRGLEPLRDCSR